MIKSLISVSGLVKVVVGGVQGICGGRWGTRDIDISGGGALVTGYI